MATRMTSKPRLIVKPLRLDGIYSRRGRPRYTSTKVRITIIKEGK